MIKGALTIFLADDHELLRDGFRILLSDLADQVSVVEASTYAELLALGGGVEAKPDLVLLDLNMPGMQRNDPLGALGSVVSAFAPAPVVIISGSDESHLVFGALKLGIRGFLPKTTSVRSMLSALRFVLSGETYLPKVLIENGEGPSADMPTPAPTALSPLTSREMNALSLLVQGKTNKEIARQLNLQEITIRMRLRNAYRKIGASNRIDAVRIAVTHGLHEFVGDRGPFDGPSRQIREAS